MKTDYIPPIALERLEDFEHYAKEAALITYNPDFYAGPFLEDGKRLRRVTFAAIGVMIREVPMTFTYTMSYEDFIDPNMTWEDQAELLEERFNKLIESLSEKCTVARGRIHTTSHYDEPLMIRP